MGQPRFTEYLLKLATDAAELKRFKAIRDGHDKSTSLSDYLTNSTGPGLSSHEAKALEKCDSRAILRAALEELEKESSHPTNPFFGISITFSCEINHIEGGRGGGHPRE